MKLEWCDQMDRLLKKLAHDGLSATQTAKAMSARLSLKVTRNAVLGRAHRLNARCRKAETRIRFQGEVFGTRVGSAKYLPPVKPIELRGRPTRALRKRVSGKAAAPDVPLPQDLRTLTVISQSVPFCDLDGHQCRWPDDLLGPSGSGMPCCGNQVHQQFAPGPVAGVQTVKAYSYCQAHLALSQSPVKASRPIRLPEQDNEPAPRRRRANSTPWDL